MRNIKKVFFATLLAGIALTGCRIEKSEVKTFSSTVSSQAPASYSGIYDVEQGRKASEAAKEVKRDLDAQIKAADAAASAASTASTASAPPPLKPEDISIW